MELSEGGRNKFSRKPVFTNGNEVDFEIKRIVIIFEYFQISFFVLSRHYYLRYHIVSRLMYYTQASVADDPSPPPPHPRMGCQTFEITL